MHIKMHKHPYSLKCDLHQFSSVHSLSHVWLFATPWTAACQASLSITNSWSLLKLMSIESVIPSNHLILFPFSSCLQSFPASGSFPVSQFFASDGQSIKDLKKNLQLKKEHLGQPRMSPWLSIPSDCGIFVLLSGRPEAVTGNTHF